MNVFDTVGPVTIGPPSGHTVGAARIGRVGRALLGKTAMEIEILPHGSSAKTYRGHGMDKVLVTGILGLSPEDVRLRGGLELAKRRGLTVAIIAGKLEDAHPNTVRICLVGKSDRQVSMQASSVDGGSVQVGMVNGMSVAFNCQDATLIVLHRGAPGMTVAVAEEFRKIGMNINNFHLSKGKKGGAAMMTIETDTAPDEKTVRRIEGIEHVNAVTFLEPMQEEIGMGLWYDSTEFLVEQIGREGRRLSELCLEEQAKQPECSAKQAFGRMAHSYEVVEKTARQGGQRDVRSASGLTSGDTFRMMGYGRKRKTLAGRVLPFITRATLMVSEWNAAMGRIVATPTVGSHGMLPTIPLTVEQEHRYTVEQCVTAFFTASVFRMMIANRACIARVQGGCQAECGSASAMTVAALVGLGGGSPTQSAHAAMIALKCVLGLICDLMTGLVEIPCIKRSAADVTTTPMAAEIALAEIGSAIPADGVILAMKRVEGLVSPTLKETTKGGLAGTMTGRRLCRQVFGGGANN